MVWMVALGGALGSVGRYLLGVFVTRVAPTTWPLGTMFINVAGSLALGLLVGLKPSLGLSERTMALLAVGCCGGFTTFSAFSLETVTLLEAGQVRSAAGYVVGSMVLSVLAAAAGLLLARTVAPA